MYSTLSDIDSESISSDLHITLPTPSCLCFHVWCDLQLAERLEACDSATKDQSCVCRQSST